MITDRAAEYRGIISRLMAGRTLKEPYGVDLGPTALVLDGQLRCAYQLIVSCDSPVLDPKRLAAGSVIVDGWPTEEQLDKSLGECLEKIGELRARLLSFKDGRSPGGLIVPPGSRP